MNKFRSRRQLLKLVGVSGFGIATTAASSVLLNAQPAQAEVAQPDNPVKGTSPLYKLTMGNIRFREQKFDNPNRSLSRLTEVAQKQQPFAAALSCADSRLPVEIIFDQGVGDIFDVRIAGNIVTPEAIGSLEYAAKKLGISLIIVLGHERCGAVKAALDGGSLPGQISTLTRAIQPAFSSELKAGAGGWSEQELLDKAVQENILYQVQMLRQKSEVLTDLEKQGKLKIFGARYDLDTGEVCRFSRGYSGYVCNILL